MSLSINQQIFYNHLVAKRCVTGDEARVLHRDVTFGDALSDDGADTHETIRSEMPSRQEFDRFWGQISTQLREHFGQEIRRMKFQEDEKLYIGVCNLNTTTNNTTNGNAETDAISKLATRMAPRDIALFRVILDEILKTDEGCAKGVDIVAVINKADVTWSKEEVEEKNNEKAKTSHQNTATQAQCVAVGKMSKREKEETLAHLCNERWLHRDPKRLTTVKLGVRSFLEFKDFVLDQCPERTRKLWEKFL